MRCIKVFNNPLWGFWFEAIIQDNGVVYYRSYLNTNDKAMFLIAKSTAVKIIQFIADKLSDFDISDIGEIVIDGHLWVIRYCSDSVIHQIKGSLREPDWRNQQIRNIMVRLEKTFCKDMGSDYMDETYKNRR